MGETRQRYNLEFKKQVVEYIQERSKSIPDIAEELNIPVSTLKKWLAVYREFPHEPFVGSGHVREEAQQVQQQKQRIRDLEEENAILKKAMHFFSKEWK